IYPLENVGLWGDFPGAPENGFPGTTFWVVFAVFFPASTGIMAGANMSGDLKTPRRSIPVGTMAAIGVSLVIYLALGYWLVRSATPEELARNYTVMIDKAFWGPAVLAGLLGATFSSALASLVGSGRILMAMGEHRVLPWGAWLGKKTETGEPRNAMVVTGVVLFLSILLRDLNAVAPLVTMFFLITYAMLNGVLLVEQSLGLTSFRPRLRVPLWVPALGLIGSAFAMFIIEPTIAWVSIAIVGAFYWILLRRRLVAPFADVRSGLFVSVAEWAAARVSELPGLQERAWKPNLLVPTREADEVRGCFDILTDLARPNGTIKLMGLSGVGGDAKELGTSLERLATSFRERNVFATSTVIDAGRSEQGVPFAERLIAGMQTLRGAFFRPNIVFLRMGGEAAAADGWVTREVDLRHVVREAEEEKVGVLLYAPHPVSSLGRRRHVNVWLRDRTPDWRISWDVGNLDLPLLVGLKLQRNWDARLQLSMVVSDVRDQEKARDFLSDLVSLARLEAEIRVQAGDFRTWVQRTPEPDVSIFGLTSTPNLSFIQTMVRESRSTCLFIRDSGAESVLA
ncbi:MAG: amino acid permease, partial [Gemmatimonadota bacterium]|nr:amino acid permease [Gemmatimonadota bacterium]